MTKLAKNSICEWKHGEQYEKFVSRLTLSDIVSLEVTPEVSNAYDTIYYHLLDNQALRDKFVKGLDDEL